VDSGRAVLGSSRSDPIAVLRLPLIGSLEKINVKTGWFVLDFSHFVRSMQLVVYYMSRYADKSEISPD
jgi:hypothetical protein